MPSSPEQRWEACRGWLAAVFDIEAIARKVLLNFAAEKHILMRLYDSTPGTTPDQGLIYDPPEAPLPDDKHDQEYGFVQPFECGGRTYEVRCWDPTFSRWRLIKVGAETKMRGQPFLASGMGVLKTANVCLAVLMIHNMQKRSYRRSNRRWSTNSLRVAAA